MPKKYYPVGHPKHKKQTDRHKDQRDRHIYKIPKFLAWDGEGYTLPDGTHRYTLFMNGKGQYISNSYGLSTEDCFDFLLDTFEPDRKNVCFAASYDINMMLADIPMSVLIKLHGQGKVKSGEYVRWKNYVLQYRPRKSFFLARYKKGEPPFIKDEKTGKKRPNYEKQTTLWDVFGFFQTSFVNALKSYFSEEELIPLGYEQIKAGKESRSTFKKEDLLSVIVPYTTLEVLALEKLMERLAGYLEEANLRLSRWDGTGAIAATILKKEKIKSYYGHVPQTVEIASQHAYGGGRIETIKYGHFKGTGFHADIRSAYPSAMLELIQMTYGYWTNIEQGPFTLYDVSWNFPTGMPFYPFFVRDSWGQICYPRQGRNWIWYPEVKAAQKFLQHEKHMHIHDVLSFHSESDVKPFSFVQVYYDRRLEWKRQGKGAEKVLKLGINSLYGKTVQQLGYDESTGRKPPFYNLQYGGLITSYTRAKLFEAGMQKPDDIIAFSTDGIWSTSPLELEEGEGLGQWEVDSFSELIQAQSGVYWVTTDKGEKQFCRGFSKTELTKEKVLEGWKNGLDSISVPCTRFVTLGSALASPERFIEKWGSWDSGERSLALTASGTHKRLDKKGGKRADRGLRDTSPQINSLTSGYDFPYPDECKSIAYPLMWDMIQSEIISEAISTEIEESEY